MIKEIFRSLFRGLAVPFSMRFWTDLFAGLHEICRAIRTLLRRIARGESRPPREADRTGCCIQLPPDIYKRADPLIYAQYYLMSQGLAVTWDNPDIDIFDGPVLVTGPLKADHRYRVRVRVWNGSYDAPAVGVDVELSYLSFGAQTVSHPIGKSSINLGVKGTIDCPAFAELEWRTPTTGGHYCVQARLDWFDDANPDNNLGQKNVDVAPLRSPGRFSFNVRNNASIPRRFALEADAYGLPELPDCGGERDPRQTRLEESRARWEQAKGTQGYGRFPVPRDWTVEITPQAFGLEPRQEQTVEVAIEPRDPSFTGTRAFNVHVFTTERERRYLLGGVTLAVTKA
jgi:hypothetical protein